MDTEKELHDNSVAKSKAASLRRQLDAMSTHKRDKLRSKAGITKFDVNLQKAQSVDKDPFFPEGVLPIHMTPVQKDLSTAQYSALKVTFKCTKCGGEQQPDDRLSGPCQPGARTCFRCNAKESQNSSLAQRINSDWQEISKDAGLELFERQPDETDTEWRIWEAYRGYYPMRLPTYNELAVATGCSVVAITKAVQKWSFKVRIMEWARFTDANIQEDRVKAIREMNKTQLALTKLAMGKLVVAITNMEPTLMKPSEITGMMKVVTDLQRSINTFVEPTVVQPSVDTGASQKQITKVEDLSAIADILQTAGVFKGKTVGIETTTRVIIKGDDDGITL